MLVPLSEINSVAFHLYPENMQECSRKSSVGSKKQPAADATSAHAETHKPNDAVTKKRVPDKLRRSPPQSLPCSVQETPKTGSLSEDVQNTEVCSPKESGTVTPRVKEADSAVVPVEELQIKTQPSAITAGTTHASPLVTSLSTHEANEDDKLTREGNAEDEPLKAPVELIIEFLRAMMDREFQVASKLCQMILIYEPNNPEASEFLPLIQKNLLEEEDAEESTDEDEDDDDDDEEDDDDDDDDDDEEDSDSDVDSPTNSSSSPSSSSSSSSSEDNEEK
ncbi:hypothetical protein Q5P01_022091 [Channa striata]|uniref:Glutamate-rich protein 2 n=1 Tax=Channa striata TaxID=64152 RepID=A0AA88LQX6_CHASR|nr:hypothetical protein Q5P01_022091 [Channa striata]